MSARTLARIAAALALGAAADLALAPLVYLLPRLLWPPLHPALPWRALWAYLAAPAGAGSRWWALAVGLPRARPWPGYALTQAALALLLGAPLLAALRGAGPAGRAPAAAAVATHGSSRWRLRGELRRMLGRTPCRAPRRSGAVLGSDGRCAWLSRPEAGSPHVLLLGSTRSGKSRRVILPTIWCLGHAGESMVLTDPKGELHAAAAAWLSTQGYEVVLVDLLRPGRGGRWNPLAAVRRAWEAGDAEEASRLAWELGNALAFGDQGAGTDPIWPQASEATIAALALAAALEAPEGCRHPATMYRILTELGGDGEGGAALDAWFRALPAGHPGRAAYGTAALSESRTRSSIFTGAAAALRTFADPGVAWLTAQSDHDPARAGLRPMAVFLLLPDEALARRPIAALYVAQAYGALSAVAREHGGRLPRPVWFLLDEFGNAGRLPGIAEKLTVAAGRGIRFLLAVQALAQIEAVYGPRVREIVAGNCDTWLFLRAADLASAQAVSAKAGTATVRTRSVSLRPGLLPGTAGSESAAGRPLLLPDEVLRWPLGCSLLLQAGEFPARLPLCDLGRWPGAASALRPGPPVPAAPVDPPPAWAPVLGEPSAEIPPRPRRPPRRSAFGRPVPAPEDPEGR